MAYAYPVLFIVETTPVKKSKVEPEQLLAAIAETVDDGFYPASSLASAFPKLTHRELVRLRKRASRQAFFSSAGVRTGGPTSSLTSEGWRALRARQTP
jgi:hypothetical protein